MSEIISKPLSFDLIVGPIIFVKPKIVSDLKIRILQQGQIIIESYINGINIKDSRWVWEQKEQVEI